MPPEETKPTLPTWPSPWPYDFPTTRTPTSVRTARLQPVETRAPVKVTRRNLFAVVAGWGAFMTAGGLGTLGLVRFLFPNVSFEPPQKFLTKAVAAFPAEKVDETWKESNGVWMVNTGGRLVAVSTICTHLGCTPNWLPGDQKFKCPCHGSGYYINGVNFEGPTPRPLERFRVAVDTVSGLVLVDKTVICRVEQGTCESGQFYLPTA